MSQLWRVLKLADPWRLDEGRWIRACGSHVVAQVTDRLWYVLRTNGSGGSSGNTRSVEAARRSVDALLLKDGWELGF